MLNKPWAATALGPLPGSVVGGVDLDATPGAPLA